MLLLKSPSLPKNPLIILKCGKSILYFTDPSQYGWPLLTMICLTLTQLGQLSQCKLVTESEDLWTKQKFIFTLYCRIDLAYRNLTLFLVYIGEYFNHTWRYFTLGFLFLSIHSEWNWSSWSKRHWGSTARRNFSFCTLNNGGKNPKDFPGFSGCSDNENFCDKQVSKLLW